MDTVQKRFDQKLFLLSLGVLLKMKGIRVNTTNLNVKIGSKGIKNWNGKYKVLNGQNTGCIAKFKERNRSHSYTKRWAK